MSLTSVLDRYEYDVLQSKIGEGAFGKVYKAYDKIRDRYVALKVSEVRFIEGKEISLAKELQALQGIPIHKNIAFYESVEKHTLVNGIYEFAVMQYYEAGSLRDLLNTKFNTITDQDKIDIIRGIFEGVRHLHNHQIIHRDLKPNNILLSIYNGSYIPKITDFGLSKIISDQDSANYSNSFVGGTLDYTSPEQLTQGKIGRATDIWALGVIVYEIWTGKKYFSNNRTNNQLSQAITIQNILQQKAPDDLSAIPSPLSDIISVCIIKDAKARAAKVDVLIDMLPAEKQNHVEIVKPIGSPIINTENEDTQHFRGQVDQAFIDKLAQREELLKEEARQLREAEAKRLAEQHALALKKAEEEARLLREAEAKRLAEQQEAERKKAEEEARRQQEAEAKRLAEQHALALKKAEEEARLLREAEAKRLAELKEAERKKAEEEEARRLQEAEAKRLAEQQALALKKAEEEARLLREAEAKRLAEQQEAERKKAEEEARRQQEAEAKRLAERKKAEEEAQKQQEAEAKRLAEQREAERKKAEEEVRRQQEAKARKKSDTSASAEPETADADAQDPVRQEDEGKKRRWLIVLLLLLLAGGGIGWYSSKKDPIKTDNEINKQGTDKTTANDTTTTAAIIQEQEKNEQLKKENQAWSLAKKTNTLDAYKEFIKKYPQSTSVIEAKKEITRLEKEAEATTEKEFWAIAVSTNSIASYESFLGKFPASVHRGSAQQNIAQLREAEKQQILKQEAELKERTDYIAAQKDGSIEALQNHLKNYPNSANKADLINMIDQKIKNEQKLAEEKARAEAEAVAAKEARSNEKVGDIVPLGSKIISKPTMTAQAKLVMDKVEDDFVTIPAGSYRTNCDNCTTDGNLLKIKEFKMLRMEVTQDLYQMVMGANPSKFNDCDKCPVENVSWQDAQNFIQKLNAMSNGTYTYRLPTEKEWEYAALAGEETKFSGSDDVEKVAWYKLNSTGTKISVNKAKNKFGLYSMSGNVSEWVAEKVVKGGSWNDNVGALQIRKKALWPANTQNPFTGFRIIRE